jgi:hypothetical protein
MALDARGERKIFMAPQFGRITLDSVACLSTLTTRGDIKHVLQNKNGGFYLYSRMLRVWQCLLGN